MDNETTMFVDFEKYCPLCVNKKKDEKFDPCNDCLAVGARPNSKRPAYFEEDER